MAGKFNQLPAKAEPPAAIVENVGLEEEKLSESSENSSGSEEKSPISHLMQSNDEFVENLKALLQKKT